MSIRTVIVGVFSTMALIIGLQLVNATHDALEARRFADAFVHDDQHGRNFIAATSDMARERGLTLIALASDDRDTVDLDAEIRSARSATDVSTTRVMDLVSPEKGTGSDIETHLADSFSALPELRLVVDDVLGAAETRNHELEEVWLLVMTDLIAQIEAARLAHLVTVRENQLPSAYYLIDHLTWRLSEMAGIERAIIGSTLPENRPLSAFERRMIGISQNFITGNWRFVVTAISDDEEVRKSLDGVATKYFGEYLAMRKTVLEGGQNRDDINAQEWFDVASAGIKSFLQLRDAHASLTTRRAAQLRDTVTRDLYIQYIESGSLILILAALYYFTNTIVIGPLGRLAAVIRDYEDDKDFVLPHQLGPKTELTEIVATLNSLSARLQNVYKIQRDKIRSGQTAIDKYERRFSDLMEAVPIGVLQLDTSQNYVFANSYWCWLTGRGPEELAGESWREVFSSADSDALLIEDGDGINVQEIRLRSKSSDVWAYLQSRKLMSAHGELLGYIVTLQDVTAKKNAQDLLQMAQKELIDKYRSESAGEVTNGTAEHRSSRLTTYHAVTRAVLDNSPFAIYLKDASDRYRLTNKAFDKLAGPDVAALTKSESSLFDTDTPRAISTECTLEGYDRAERVFSTHVFPVLDERKALIGTGGMLVDITDQRAFQQEILHLQKNQAVGELTSGVVHDLSNILTSLIGNLEVMRSRANNACPVIAHAHESLKAARRAELLTQRLLAFSRQRVLKPKLVDINAAITDMMTLFKEACGDGILIRTSLSQNLGWVMVDPAQLDSAFLNVMLNSRDAMAGSGLISIETEKHVITDEECGEHQPADYFVRVTITDNGEGIPESIRDKIFEPFFSTKREGKGTGLGLSMVHGFVEQSGGFAEIDSRVGSGTRIRLSFPAADVNAKKIGGGKCDCKPNHLDLESLPGGNEVVMIVEDDRGVLEIASTVLGSLGYRVRRAGNAAEALAGIDQDSHVNLLFTDLVLPGDLGGMELCHALKQKIAGLKVLLTTGQSEKLAAEAYEVEDQIAILHKPYDPTELAEAIREALDSPKRFIQSALAPGTQT